jgi:glycosyltransferase involved in cell wall biosynthesis
MKKPSQVAQIAVIIPAFNEGPVINEVVREVVKHGYQCIIVVDDGSSDETGTNASTAGAIVLRHKLNRGKGAAVKTGVEVALQMGADIVVTMDGDGQHNPADIERLIAPLQNSKYEVVFGTRWPNRKKMPSSKKLFTIAANTFSWAISHHWVSDSQCGFRAYTHHASRSLTNTADFYDYETQVVRDVRLKNLSSTEVPISATYSAYSQQKQHKQTIRNGILTMYKLFHRIVF